MNLPEALKQLQKALEPLGIEVGRETLNLWLDRVRAGQEPLPEAALRDVALWVEKLLADTP